MSRTAISIMVFFGCFAAAPAVEAGFCRGECCCYCMECGCAPA